MSNEGQFLQSGCKMYFYGVITKVVKIELNYFFCCFVGNDEKCSNSIFFLIARCCCSCVVEWFTGSRKECRSLCNSSCTFHNKL